MAFADLSLTSNFTFLTGASHPEELVARAAELGLAAVAIADRNTLAGVVRAHVAAREIARELPPSVSREEKNLTADVAARGARAKGDAGGNRPAPPIPKALLKAKSAPRLIVGARLAFEDHPDITALPVDRAAYGRLCRLLTLGKRRAEKGGCRLLATDLDDWADGMVLLLHGADAPFPHSAAAPGGAGLTAPGAAGLTAPQARRWARRLPGSAFLVAAPAHDGRDAERLAAIAAMGAAAGAPMVAISGALMHHPRRRRLADVLTAIRTGRSVDRLGRDALPHAEARMRPETEMRALFAAHPEAVDRPAKIAARLRFSLDELRYEYPDEVCEGEEPQPRLERLTREGLARRYPDGAPERVRAMAERELRLIEKLDYARYFLTVREAVAFAESRGILAQGRGSAANSVVCYALGVTAIGPDIATMVFERFVSEARDEPPDIDVDFEHERREEVIQHVYEKYGRHRAGLCATVIHFRARAAIREVGKAMGLSADATAALASQIWGFSSETPPAERLAEIGLDPTDRRLAATLALAHEIMGFPRHLSQHVGGFVITRGRLDELVPIENAAMEDRTVIEWDKDDVAALGMLKVDLLSLGMLTCVRKALDLIAQHGGPRYTLATIPPEDPAVYDMLCEADSLGVFQVESRAQMNFLPRMRPRKFYDLVIQVAIVRPGPIQGDMVHPYLRRRRGEEPFDPPSDALGAVLGKTLGVPLFQEQAMQIAIIGAGFDPSEADRLRRALATFRKTGTIHTFRDRFVGGMLRNGHDRAFAERCFAQIEGFGEYGFPESHAASFALLVYASAWIKRRHPAIFACALLNSQPMGFYAPAQIVRDAHAHGVEARPVDVNHSYWDCSLETDGRGRPALRLGFRQVKGLREEEARWIPAARGNGYQTVADLWRKAGLRPQALATLAEADAFGSIGLGRREALWAAKAVKGAAPPPLFAGLLDGEAPAEPPVALPPTTEGEEVVEDYVATRLTLRSHPLALLRPRLTPARGRPWPLDDPPPPAAADDARAAFPAADDVTAAFPPPADIMAAFPPPADITAAFPPPADITAAFPPPAGSAGAAHFRGAPSLSRVARSDALRARAEGRPPPEAREPGADRETPDPDLRRTGGGPGAGPGPRSAAPPRTGGETERAFPPPAGWAGADYYAEQRRDDGALPSLARRRRERLERRARAGLAAAPEADAPIPRIEGEAPPPAFPRPAPEESPAPRLSPPERLPPPSPPPPSARGWPRPPLALPAARLDEPPEGARVTVAGLVVVRQRPGSAKGVIFVTLEDETGVANVVVWSKIYERFRREVIAGRMLRVTGRLQREGRVIHLVAERVEDLSPLLDTLAETGRSFENAFANADEVRRAAGPEAREKGRAQARTQGLIQGAVPRADHPRAQANRLIRRGE